MQTLRSMLVTITNKLSVISGLRTRKPALQPFQTLPTKVAIEAPVPTWVCRIRVLHPNSGSVKNSLSKKDLN